MRRDQETTIARRSSCASVLVNEVRSIENSTKTKNGAKRRVDMSETASCTEEAEQHQRCNCQMHCTEKVKMSMWQGRVSESSCKFAVHLETSFAVVRSPLSCSEKVLFDLPILGVLQQARKSATATPRFCATPDSPLWQTCEEDALSTAPRFQQQRRATQKCSRFSIKKTGEKLSAISVTK